MFVFLSLYVVSNVSLFICPTRCPWTYWTACTHPSWHAIPRTTWPHQPTYEPSPRCPTPSCWCLWSGSARCSSQFSRSSQWPRTGPAYEAGGPSGLSEATDGQALKIPPATTEDLNTHYPKPVMSTNQIQSKHRSWLFSYFSSKIKKINVYFSYFFKTWS